MLERLSERMERVVKLAEEIAREYELDYVGTEHLLLAILREGTGVAANLLHERRVDEATARGVVDRLIKQRMEDTWVLGRLPGSPHFRNVIAKAIDHARRRASKHVCTEHLLLALLAEEGSVAAAALAELGIKAAEIAAAINRPPRA